MGDAGDELLRPRAVMERRAGRGAAFSNENLEHVVLCHQATMLGGALSRWRARRVRGFSADVRILRGSKVAVATRFGVGAPAAVVCLEELVACGARRFVSIGIAGALRADATPGDLMVVDRAISAEGTSAHYRMGTGSIEATASLTQALSHALSAASIQHSMGAVCSTDAPYRTTTGAVRHWTEAGAAMVDMEAAALLAAAGHRHVEIAVGLCVADRLSMHGWDVGFDEATVERGVRALFQAAIEVLAA